jgi:hypothetical protein
MQWKIRAGHFKTEQLQLMDNFMVTPWLFTYLHHHFVRINFSFETMNERSLVWRGGNVGVLCSLTTYAQVATEMEKTDGRNGT